MKKKKFTGFLMITGVLLFSALWIRQELSQNPKTNDKESSPLKKTSSKEGIQTAPLTEAIYKDTSGPTPEPAKAPASAEPIEPSFESTEITDAVFERIYGKSYKTDCTIPREELRYLSIPHYGFDGEIHLGEMVVNAAIADEVLEIFQELYAIRYPIEKIRLVDDYDADDERSMADNNSSAFNYRTISGTNKLSNHSRGLAIDINPLYNPYVHSNTGTEVCEPANASAYTDRTASFDHKIDEFDPCYQIFTAHGFSWGGNWTHAKDYQHFEFVSFQDPD